MMKFRKISVQSLVVLAVLAAAYAPVPATTLQQLVEAAKMEGKIAYATTTPAEIIAELNKRFNQRFGVNVTVELIPLRASQAATRLSQEIPAGKVTLDVLHPSYTLVVAKFGKLDVFEAFDWIGTFGENTLPSLRKQVERAPKYLRNKVLEYGNLTYGLAYNTRLLTKAEVPKKYDDLLNPKWKGRKIIIDPRGNSTYLLAVKFGHKWAVDYSAKLLDQKPLFVRGTPAIGRAVAKGEAPIGFTNGAVTLKLKRQGQPIDLAPVEWTAVQQLMFVPKGAPHPNAGRLWVAWLATDGFAMARQLGEVTAERVWPDSKSEIADAIRAVGSDVTILTSPEKIEQARKALRAIALHIQTRQR